MQPTSCACVVQLLWGHFVISLILIPHCYSSCRLSELQRAQNIGRRVPDRVVAHVRQDNVKSPRLRNSCRAVRAVHADQVCMPDFSRIRL